MNAAVIVKVTSHAAEQAEFLVRSLRGIGLGGAASSVFKTQQELRRCAGEVFANRNPATVQEILVNAVLLRVRCQRFAGYLERRAGKTDDWDQALRFRSVSDHLVVMTYGLEELETIVSGAKDVRFSE